MLALLRDSLSLERSAFAGLILAILGELVRCQPASPFCRDPWYATLKKPWNAN